MLLADVVEPNWDPDSQRVAWLPDEWRARWVADGLPHPDAVDAVAVEYSASGTIRRGWLHERSTADPVDLLIATMAWGFGDDHRGLYRVLRMLTQPPRGGGSVGTVAREIVDASRCGAAEGFTALFHNWRPRLDQLGVAFGTKLVHFAGYSVATPRPLVLDYRVYLGAERLDDVDVVPDPRKRVTSASYVAYCQWAEDVASEHGVEPAAIEYALWRTGRA